MTEWCGWPIVEESTDWETAQKILTDTELSDGLPLVPPTQKRLDAMVAGLSNRTESLGMMPPMFGDVTADTPDDVVATWEKVKAVEKAHRTSVLEGIPQGMPSLALADKTLGRAAKVGVVREAAVIPATEQELGDELLAMVVAAKAAGLDSERALRGALRTLQDEVRRAEATPPE